MVSFVTFLLNQMKGDTSILLQHGVNSSVRLHLAELTHSKWKRRETKEELSRNISVTTRSTGIYVDIYLARDM